MFTHRNIIICLGMIIASYFLISCDSCAGVDCGPHGNCIGGFCVCTAGYTGDNCEIPPIICTDWDGDGHDGVNPVNCPSGDDCNDSNADVYPGAPELCDKVDNQCPGDVGHGQNNEDVCSLVFISQRSFTGGMGGWAGANSHCQSDAYAAGIEGVFMAWISDGPDGHSPSSTFSTYGIQGPYIDMQGTTIAVDQADLMDGNLLAPINVKPDGFRLIGCPYVWTNTRDDGDAVSVEPNEICNEWHSIFGAAAAGRSCSTDNNWTQGSEETCNDYLHLYCFQAAPY